MYNHFFLFRGMRISDGLVVEGRTKTEEANGLNLIMGVSSDV